MTENEIAKIVVNVCFKIHSRLGPGLFESVYEEILNSELIKAGLTVNRQVGIPVVWNDLKMDQGFRADLIVGNKVIIEIKSVKAVAPVHKTIINLFKINKSETWIIS